MPDSRKPSSPPAPLCFSALQTLLRSLNACCINLHPSASPILIKESAQISCVSMANWFLSLVVFTGLDRCAELRNNLVGVYGRCGSYEDARALFHGIIRKDVRSWDAIIGTCVEYGHNHEVFFLFAEMIEGDVTKPNKIMILRLLVAASRIANMSELMVLHSYLAECNYDSDLFVGNALLNLYGKRGSLQDLERVFSWMSIRDVVSWTTMIGAHARLNNCEKAFKAYGEMQASGIEPNAITYINLLKVFNDSTALAEGKAIHALIQRNGLETDPVIANSLISMYGRCGCLEEALIVFNKMHKHDVVSWNAIIAVCAQQGCNRDAIGIFKAALWKGLKPNNVTFVSILDAFAGEKSLEEGRLIQSMISENGIKLDIVLETALLNMYGKCGRVIDARCIFEKMPERNVVSWTAILTVFSEHGYITETLELFSKMIISNIWPNNVTFVAILDVCKVPDFQAEGRLIHFTIVSGDQHLDVTVGNALLNMYNNCDQLDDAVALFNRLPNCDVVAWTAMIGAYSQHDRSKEAFCCFAKMLESCVSPNNITFISLLNTCAALSDLAVGKLLHNFIIEIGFILDCDTGTALVDMYGKCGRLQEAHVVFLSFSDKDVVSWNVILAAFAQQGYGKQTLQLYFTMEKEHVHPNLFTFISLINACSHAGLVDLGRHYFDSMEPKYGITPTIEHYICMVDLLGRAGQLEEAENFIKDMPIPPTAMVWMTYLSACKLHNNLEKGELAAENVQKLEPKNLSVYVVLSNIYAAVEKQRSSTRCAK